MATSECACPKQIKKAIDALFQIQEKTQKKDDLSASLAQPEPVRLMLTFKKIPNVRDKRCIINLPNTLIVPTTDICLIVKDLDKESRDTDKTIEHYKDLLASKGLKRRIDIMPLKKIKLEYSTFEAKRNLFREYDVFLSDSCVRKILPRLLGKPFMQNQARMPRNIDFQAADLKDEINQALSNAHCIITGRGPISMVTVAHMGMTKSQIAKNVNAVVDSLPQEVPGGPANIRALGLTLHGKDTPVLPIYMSLGRSDEVELPEVPRSREGVEPMEVTTVEDGLVKIHPYGRITVVKDRKRPTNEDDSETLKRKIESTEEEPAGQKAKKALKKAKKAKKAESEEPTNQKSKLKKKKTGLKRALDSEDVEATELTENVQKPKLKKKTAQSKTKNLEKTKATKIGTKPTPKKMKKGQ